MTRRSTVFTITLLAMTGVAAASELAPGNGHSIHLGGFNGAVYYTVEKDGYRVVATLASGAEAQPIRFVSTLEPGERLTISVPQAMGQPSADFEIIRDGTVLFVQEPFVRLIDTVATSAILEE
ncbi:hypothetical protein BMJ34_00575 [Sinorhizobium medicae]|uniref:DUF2846 domain-containing protein n=1 Tax=Sinorhizobium medicae TaxID=110321 RepID=A0ABX4TE28_9HYPH|nr:hypothetical protein [Sinorhizobium medicae]PLT92986.1 hypothetical protein BMJ33_32660 [Sinorhizobium medicae]PLU08764.1 hypothetical protein BMJ34_00575 [Sinorhizobium medicae]PLU12057.1 hypothetical protein BMJ29_33120 [Sinorhizobium medicae]PLU14087.1 hypothetical protein BMJ30_23960 [Sinorhizobium medicae]PLU35392.1 hypothetical protein BMJ27_13540 [Sinorhizobium medicae]